LFLLLQNDRLPTQARDTSKAPATVSQQTEHTPPRCLLFPFLLVFSLAQGAARVGGGDGRAAAGAGEAAAPAAAAPAGGGLAVLYYEFLYCRAARAVNQSSSDRHQVLVSIGEKPRQ
jgi:hypothetical protein